MKYSPAGSVDTFINNTPISSIDVILLDREGKETAFKESLVSSGISAVNSTVTSKISSGKIAGLVQIRDKDIPLILEQLDKLADTIRSEFNTVHNDGVAYPPQTSLTGTRSILATELRNYGGSTRIAVLDNLGQPVKSPYPDETYYRPLKLDLSTLDSGSGPGRPDVQTIMDEINLFYGSPQKRVRLVICMT